MPQSRVKQYGEQEIEYLVFNYIKRLRGRLVRVSRVMGYDGDDQVEIFLNPPALMEVEGGVHDHWGDEWNDPYIDLKLIAPDPRLAGVGSFFCYGDSYRANGTCEPTQDFVLADDLSPWRVRWAKFKARLRRSA